MFNCISVILIHRYSSDGTWVAGTDPRQHYTVTHLIQEGAGRVGGAAIQYVDAVWGIVWFQPLSAVSAGICSWLRTTLKAHTSSRAGIRHKDGLLRVGRQLSTRRNKTRVVHFVSWAPAKPGSSQYAHGHHRW